MDTGVYTITNLINNKIYVGSSSVSITNRKIHHYNAFRRNNHSNILLQRAYNKYGECNLVFEILELYSPEYCITMEQYWINMLDACNKLYGYNILSVAGSSSGYKHTGDNKLKMSEFKKNNPGTKETFSKISKAHLGKLKSKECKLKIAEGLKNKKKTEEHKKNISLSKSQAVLQFDKQNVFIKEWETVLEAMQNLKIDKSNIRACCRNIAKTAGGFIWKYK